MRLRGGAQGRPIERSSWALICMEPYANEVSEDRRTVERLRNAASDIRQIIADTQTVIDESLRLIGLASKMANPNILAEDSN